MKKILFIFLLISTFHFAGDCSKSLDVQNFVQRFYSSILERNADNAGMDDWTNQLTSRKKTGADVAQGFIFSSEYDIESKSNTQYLYDLYAAFFNREADITGFNTWLNKLNTGTSKQEVLRGFLYSNEFEILTNSYGIQAYEGASFVSTEITNFVQRFYSVILGRSADNAGLQDWTSRLSTANSTGADIARGFIFSAEYHLESKSNTEYINDLYSAFFNRVADIEGFNNWMAQLNTGTSRSDVLDGFLGSEEFTNLTNSYGILAFLGAAQTTSTNLAPTADAGKDQNKTLGIPASFNGSGSVDSDGSIGCYWWKEGNTLLATSKNMSKSDFSIGSHTVTLTVVDDDGVSASDSTQLSVFIEPEKPIAYGQSVVLNIANTDYKVTLNASSANGTLIYTIVAQPQHGTLIGVAPHLKYVPNDGYIGTDSFSYKVSNAEAESEVVTIDISVLIFNTLKDTYSTHETVDVHVETVLLGDEDWVGIFPVGVESTWGNVVAWNWVSNNGTTQLSTKLKSISASEYEARLFYHNSFVAEASYRFTTREESYADLGEHTPVYHTNNLLGDQKYIAYYPENGITADMPVVMFIKGGGASTIEDYSGIMQFMASKGYFAIGVDANSYASSYVTQKLEVALNEVKVLHGLTVKKLAIMGHSLGGGQAFYAMKKFRDDGYGSEGSLALSIDGWFAFNMDKIDLNLLDSKVAFLQMNGVNGTGTDPRIHLKIWNLSTQADRAFYTLPSNDHSYVGGNLENVLGKEDLLFSIGALTDDAFRGVSDGTNAIPQANKVSYDDIFNALQAEDTYNSGDCQGIQYNAISVIQHNDIDYCDLTPSVKKYPATTTLVARAPDNTVTRPTLGTVTIDPIYETRISMVDKPDQSTSAYPKVQNWNADMRLIRISNRIYDAKTLTETNMTKTQTNTQAYTTLCSRASDYFRWSNKVANKFYVINSSYEFIQGKIVGDDVNCSNVLDAFSEYEVVHMGPHEGNIDYDDKYVVFVAKKPAESTFYAILYDIQNKTRVWTKTMPSQTWQMVNGTWTPSTLDWLSVSPSGKYIAFNKDSNNTDGMYRYDINLTNKTKLQFDYAGALYSVGGHGDIGYDTDGNEVYVQFIGGVGVYSFNLDNPAELGKELLGSPYGGGHISCRNSKRPGWCYITANNDSNGNGLRRVFALKIDGTGDENIQNFSLTHIDTGYHDGYGGPTPDGTQVIFNSHWGTGSIGSFVVEAE